MIIPRKGLAELKRLVDEDDADEIELGFEGNSGLVRKGEVTLTMRLIEGEFPNYRQVIPKVVTRKVTMPSDTLSQALRRVALLSVERSQAVRVELSAGRLRLSANNPDLGEARKRSTSTTRASPSTVGFNARYLLDASPPSRPRKSDSVSRTNSRPPD